MTHRDALHLVAALRRLAQVVGAGRLRRPLPRRSGRDAEQRLGWLDDWPWEDHEPDLGSAPRARVVKRALRYGAAVALTHVFRLSARRCGVAIVYHAVGLPASSPGSRLSPRLDPGVFSSQLRMLARSYELVPSSQLQARALRRRRGDRFPAAVTFDDDLRSHLLVAAPILRGRGVTATFFLSGASLEQPASYWFERVDRALDKGMTLDDAILPNSADAATCVAEWGGGPADVVGEAIRELSPAARDELAVAMLDKAGPDPDDAGLRAEHVRALCDQGFEIGFHTARHDSLTDLDDAALREALECGRGRLEAVCDRPLTVIAYPHGRADARVARATRASGYLAGFTTDPGLVADSSDPMRLPRFSPSHDSAAALAWELARGLARARG